MDDDDDVHSIVAGGSEPDPPPWRRIYDDSPLDTSKREIRLLHLLEPEPDSQVLRGRLGKVVLTEDAPPEYNALSYAWGSTEGEQKEIVIDGAAMPITPNLHAALLRIRADFRSRPIWADAVCIDQASNVEKNHQVPFMRDIYRQATRVLVWLGTDTPLTTTAIKCFNIWAAAEEDLPFSTWEDLAEAAAVAVDDATASILEFVGADWFKRYWVLQEFAVARDEPHILIGPFTLLPNALEKAAARMRTFVQQPGFHPPGSCATHVHDADLNPMLQGLLTRRDFTGDFELREMRFLLNRSEDRNSTLPHDSIYSLLGLTEPSFAGKISIDYDEPVTDVFANFMQALISHYQTLNLLSLTRPGSPPAHVKTSCHFAYLVRQAAEDRHCHASWVPDFGSLDRQGKENIFNAFWGEEKVYRASLSIPASFKFREGRILSVRGLVVDSILGARNTTTHRLGKGLNVRDNIELKNIVDLFFRASRSCLQFCSRKMRVGAERHECPELLYCPPDSDTVTTMMEAIWRTVFLDRDLESECAPLSDSTREHFEDIMNDSGAIMAGNVPQRTLHLRLTDRAAFVTPSGWIGIGESSTRMGDVVAILFGSDAPVILRPQGDNYKLIGHCYLHGIMKGEFVRKRMFRVSDLDNCDGIESEWFNIC